MKIIISPAKQMRPLAEFPLPRTVPVFLEQTKKLLTYLRGLSYAELKELLACNDKLTSQNYERFQTMNLEADQLTVGSAAILSYDGIQYKYMAPHVFENDYFTYVQNHVRILSGFYGILRPLDAIVAYRLEMQAKLSTDFCRDLYDFWGDSPCRELLRGEENPAIVLNLASLEYSRLIERHLPPQAHCLTCLFGEVENDKVREKGVYVKMARGEMVRYLAENRVTGSSPAELTAALKDFNRLDFRFNPARSDEKTLAFTR